MSSYNDNLLWRYATKKFDTTKKVSPADLDELVESTRLAASSYGLQPYKILVITDAAIREKLKAAAWNQAQLTDASHVVLFCARTDLDAAYIAHFIELIAKTRGMKTEDLKVYNDMMVGSMERMTLEARTDWAKMQAYIALGFLLSACAQKHIDSCPMEGFDAAQFDDILGLIGKNLTSAVLCPVGYRTADDELAGFKKVRFPKEELFEFIG